MKTLINYNHRINPFLTCIIFLLTGCQSEINYWDKKPEEMVISQYIESNPDFSEFNEILEVTGLKSILSVRGPYTLFLPSNSQMKDYYKLKGLKSYNEFSIDILRELVLNHIIQRLVETNEIGLGAINEPNAIGDYIATEFKGSEIILNKYSKIIKHDILTANGIIHLIDKVLDPVTKNVFDVLADNKAYSIFTAGLKLTKLSDTLQTIYFPFGSKTARSWFTILAVADTTFYRFGIFTIEKLVARFTQNSDASNNDNGFYRYMEYHCLAETYYLNQLNTKLYPVLSHDNNILITVDNDYKINLKDNNNYTKFVIEHCNIPAKNGTIHTINDLLPVVLPRPTTIEWEVTDHFDLKQGDYYKKYYQRFFDGQNTFANIKWGGDYLLYFYNIKEPPINNDCLMMDGWWWIEVTTPKIMKGKYKVSGNTGSGSNKSIIDVIVDGEYIVYGLKLQPNATFFGDFEWTKTETHKVKLVARSAGLFMWDAITFTPIR